MRTLLLLAALATTLAAPAASAHTEPPAGKPVAAAIQPAATTGTRDPRAYFTDADLTNQDGRKLRFYSDVLKGRTVVLSVGYTSCTEACPLITRQLVQAREELGDTFGKKVFFVMLTSDPARDTPQALKAFAHKQGADVAGWTFLTGRTEDVHMILKRLGAFPEDVGDHSTALYIMDVDAKRMRRLLANLPPKAIAEAARIIATSGKAPAPGAR
ncbi:SCO family protein [Ramlibacter sp. AN1133]|uniref:SCO family protein n=1 Tax=Ramlibacter sp. AN1133 TaxID=3133429 RepID=UPI0030BB949B